MTLRLALVALLALGSVAGAAEGDAGRREPAAAPRPAPAGSADFPRIVFRRAERAGERSARTETTVVAPARARLELESFGGDIRVTGWDRGTVRVVADHEPGTRVAVTVQPAAVVVRAIRELRVPGLERGRGAPGRNVSVPVRVDYRLSVPRGTSLRLSGVDTQILVDGVQGDVSAETVLGPVAVRGARGSVRVGTFDGAVEIVGVRGSVEAASMSQDVLVRDVEGPVRAESVKGNLELTLVQSEAVEAGTVSGWLRYEGSIRAGGEYRFASHSGDVTVVMPERPDASVTVATHQGSFQSSFPVPARQPRDGGRFEFLLGDGRAELEVTSFSGAIRLLRAGEKAALAPPAPAKKP